MKTYPQVSFRPKVSRVFVLLPVLLLAVTALRAVPDTPPAAPVQPFTLFLGADFAIEQDNVLYRVQDVVGGSFVIKVKGQDVLVPMDRGLQKFKVTPVLKLTESSAVVAKFTGERAYTLANDPAVQAQRAMAQSQMQYSDSLAQQHQVTAAFQSLTAQGAIIAATPKDTHSTDQTRALVTSINQSNAQLALQGIANGPGSNYNTSSSDSTEGAFDAMNVAFELTADKALNEPFVVIIAQYRPPGGKPDQVGNWIYARALEPIGHKARKVSVEQGGFPPGFELVDLQVHLYNRGVEVATNIAPKRVALTREEAQQHVVDEYVASHPGVTLPAAPAMGKLPADVRTRLASGQLQQTYFIKVGRDGKVAAAFADEACTQKVDDPYLQSLVQNIRFKPALDNGNPVEAVAPLKISQLLI